MLGPSWGNLLNITSSPSPDQPSLTCIMNQSPTQASRPYRSKRRRPCDVCRRRKQSCRLDGSGPCSSCRTLGTECTFLQPPCKKRRGVQPSALPLANEPLSSLDEDSRSPQPQDLTWTLDDPPATAFQMFGQDFNDFANPQQNTLFPSHYGLWREPLDQNDFFALDVLHRPQDEPGITHIASATDHANIVADAAVDRQFTDDRMPRSSNDTVVPNDERSTSVSPETLPLDGTAGMISQYLGLSGDMDPHMLLHMRFSKDDTRKLSEFNYRQVFSGVETDRHANGPDIPVHFIQVPHVLANPVALGRESFTEQEIVTKKRVEDLVSPEIGARLIGLFFRYIFPSLPVLSRSCMGLRSETLIPKIDEKSSTPAHLLACIYALAIPYCRYDPVLCVSHIFSNLSTKDLWSIAQEGVLRGPHTPQLHTLQTILLCLQMPSDASTAIVDNSTRWSLVCLALSISTSLGLHLDCASWSIPAWEKRLRRRLWWIVYTEITWRSLLMGYPNPISDDQWSVAPLTNDDFLIDNIFCPSEQTNRRARSDQEPCLFCHNGYDFKFLANLSVIADGVYRCFNTLKASQTLGSDFDASLQAMEPLLQKLEQWHDNLPLHLRTDSTRQTSALQSSFHSTSGAHLRLAYLTLGLLLYRAVFRPLCTASPPAHTTQSATALAQLPGLNDSRISGIKAATATWINSVLSYSENLTARDRNSFWFSWSHICFATISNFILFRLLQSSDRTEARQTMPLTRRWAEILRDQSVSFEQMRFGLLRLDMMFVSGFENVFHCEKFLKDVLYENVKSAGPQPT